LSSLRLMTGIAGSLIGALLEDHASLGRVRDRMLFGDGLLAAG
jgi:hypothetical protein